MKKVSLFKKAVASVATIALAAGIFFSAGTVHAIPYDGDATQPSPVPAFNVFTGVPNGVNNESDFLRARVPVGAVDTTTPYVDPLNATCEAGQKIQMKVYVHNGASQYENGNGSGASVAHGTKLKVMLPSNEAASFTPIATISAANAATVNDTTVINCNGKVVKLKYVAGSAKQNSIATGTVALGDEIVTSGVSISSHGVAGDVWGCWDERVYVLLTVEVEAVTPVTPIYSCDLLTVTKLADNKFRFSVNYTASNGATFKNVSYDFGDGAKKDDVATADHTYTDLNNSKKVTATANFTVDGKTVSKTSDKCAGVVSFVKKPVTPPAELPNTGAGSTIAIFLGVSFIGAFLYRMRALRGSN